MRKLKSLFILVVGILLGVILTRLYTNLVHLKTDENRFLLNILKENLYRYRIVCGSFPSKNVGLKALQDPSLSNCKEKGILGLAPVDPWLNSYIYVENEKEVMVYSSEEPDRKVIIKKDLSIE